MLEISCVGNEDFQNLTKVNWSTETSTTLTAIPLVPNDELVEKIFFFIGYKNYNCQNAFFAWRNSVTINVYLYLILAGNVAKVYTFSIAFKN